MVTKKRTKPTAKRKGPISVAELKSRPKPTSKRTSAAPKASANRKTARGAYRFVSENLKRSRKKASHVDLSVFEQVHDKLLSLLLEAFDKQHRPRDADKKSFGQMRKEWLHKRLAGLTPVKKLQAIKKKLRSRGSR